MGHGHRKDRFLPESQPIAKMSPAQGWTSFGRECTGKCKAVILKMLLGIEDCPVLARGLILDSHMPLSGTKFLDMSGTCTKNKLFARVPFPRRRTRAVSDLILPGSQPPTRMQNQTPPGNNQHPGPNHCCLGSPWFFGGMGRRKKKLGAGGEGKRKKTASISAPATRLSKVVACQCPAMGKADASSQHFHHAVKLFLRAPPLAARKREGAVRKASVS